MRRGHRLPTGSQQVNPMAQQHRLQVEQPQEPQPEQPKGNFLTGMFKFYGNIFNKAKNKVAEMKEPTGSGVSNE